MGVMMRGLLFALALTGTATATAIAEDPPPPASRNAADYSDPKSTYRAYIEAIRRNDVEAAKKCWTIDDDNKSGALDAIVGLWTSTRRICQAATKKFGAARSQAVLRDWYRGDVNDQALDLTKGRLAGAEIKYTGDTAKLTITWEPDDWLNAFEYDLGPTPFRKVNGGWKIDANEHTGTQGADFMKPGTWGPMFRDSVVIMNEAAEAVEKNKLKTSEELGIFLERKADELIKRYEAELNKKDGRGSKKTRPNGR